MAAETNSDNDTVGITSGNLQGHEEPAEIGQQLDHLEIDDFDDNWDGDSALGGMSVFSSTQSVNSSIYDHVIENGRTYHRFKGEQRRLDYQHQLYTAVLNGKLFIAPVGDRLRNVLDVGTGTGIWAIEVGLEHPGAHITGTDLSPIQPSYAPPNVSFEICDAEDEWSFRQPFDLIHMRAMITCFKNFRAIFEEAYRSLTPGGFIELRDPILPFAFLTPPPEGCALQEWGEKLMEAARLSGRDWGIATRYSQMLSDIGFVNVTERRETIALSPWVKGSHNKQLSLLLQHDILNMLEPMSMALFTRVLGWDAKRVLDCLELVKKDVQNTKIHAYSEGVHIYAQKPY
ncbi:S-adenosyl-L-methionine-dependent methyltransferase [Xylaria bambusicola]|uniref:S-adenosyl-L-methionine-dependent methyltransferase n=1 Tax=Xylaria bambusicola TaxID=326684 RepID=UPI002008CA55|nr:S-adenosyl-L-methionine-dependent methyltransferase [Xylaria bambusicola]KAI0522225.1 S-adenosyl-L-methionine-dependent methyltransferase [Xylaria bambusicola]